MRRWNSVSVDFIVGLPESNGYNAILVVVGRLSKMAHYIPTTEKVTSEQVARLLFDKVFKHHGIPDSIISDQGTQFTSKFSKALSSLIGINQGLSTSFHPQTDGQTERTNLNTILEQYLRGYINYQQNNWAKLLTIAESSYNNTISATTGITPFFALYGQHPRYMIKPRTNQKIPTLEALKEWANELGKLNSYLYSEINYSQAVQAEQADQHRLPAPMFQIADKVWLLRRHIQTT